MATKAQKKLMLEIAVDILARIKNFKIINGSYLSVSDWGKINKAIEGLSIADQVSKKISAIQSNCMVCAKGATFLSYVKLKNNVTYEELGCKMQHNWEDEGTIKSVLSFQTDIPNWIEKSGKFSTKTLDLIEIAFEKWGSAAESGVLKERKGTKAQKQKAYEFGAKHKTSKARLKAIMENIVENNGEFVP